MTANPQTLPVSLNEFRFYAVRAIVGCGLKHGINIDYGMADSLANAAIYGAAIGVDPADLLVTALHNIDASADSNIEPQDNPFTQAIAIADSVLMGHDIGTPIIGKPIIGTPIIGTPIFTDSPLLIGCMVGHSLLQHPQNFDNAIDNIALQWNQHCLIIGKGLVWLSDTIMMDTNQPVDLHIKKQALPTDGRVDVRQNISALHQHAMQISKESWRILYDFYHHILVPSTDESRLAGAGAGLVDND